LEAESWQLEAGCLKLDVGEHIWGEYLGRALGENVGQENRGESRGRIEGKNFGWTIQEEKLGGESKGRI
jgi:hypothetical protein